MERNAASHSSFWALPTSPFSHHSTNEGAGLTIKYGSNLKAPCSGGLSGNPARPPRLLFTLGGPGLPPQPDAGTANWLIRHPVKEGPGASELGSRLGPRPVLRPSPFRELAFALPRFPGSLVDLRWPRPVYSTPGREISGH